MDNRNFSVTLLTDQPPETAFKAINHVQAWWGGSRSGPVDQLGDVFNYRHGDLHDSTQQLIEVVPNKRVVWLVTDSSLSFLQNKSEWNGTRIIFEIFPQDGQTAIRFTHEGLTPSIECYGACGGGWNYYLQQSLLPLINTGLGKPDISLPEPSTMQA